MARKRYYVDMIYQENGSRKGTIHAPDDATEQEVRDLLTVVDPALVSRSRKLVIVPGRLVNVLTNQSDPGV